jgi:beta-galactosidase
VGGDGKSGYVSAYELYTAPFGSSADKVLASLARHPYVAGGFVWSGWDYLGEPTPFYSARSSYFGVIDLAGFKKDRFYLYQAAWRPGLKMAHMIPHWTWPDRVGAITPVHVFTSGDEAELFLNGRSMGRKRKGAYEYRLRWDSVRYEPGEIKVVAYKDGEEWATAVRKTAGEPAKLKLSADRNVIHADGQDLSFITVEVLDANNVLVPNSSIPITFEISGPGVIVATDNGDPADLTSFHSHTRKAFGGLSLAIVKGTKGQKGEIQVRATSGALRSEPLVIKINP